MEKINKLCKFDKAWIGECNNPVVSGEDYCEEHLNTECVVCGYQAVSECTYASSLSCGSPLCEDDDCRVKHGEIHGYRRK